MMSLIDERILILTSTQKDSESTRKLISKWKLQPEVCHDFNDLLSQIAIGAGTLIIAKEILIGSNLEKLIETLNAQESWSDLPVIVLASTGDLTEANTQAIQMLRKIRNTTILERPVRIATLMSILDSALANRKRQYEVRDLVNELVEARKDAEHANQSKSAFLANMSHEIRTPLGIILGFTEFALDSEAQDSEIKTYVKAIQKNGRILLEIVNDILDLAKVESGHITTENIESNTAEIFNDVISSFHAVASKKNVHVQLNVKKDLPARIVTDPTRVRQILANVLGNAVKFTSKGQVLCDVDYSELENENILFKATITDTGMGISESQIIKLFKPFSQADSSMARKFGGTGLGLVLSKKLAQNLGGDLKLIKTVQGVGSTFELSFVAKKSKQTQSYKPDVALNEVTTNFSGLRVLVAEDSLDNQFIISRILNQMGIKVELAENGREAVNKALSHEYDVVLMDIQMPQMDGTEATKLLREKGYQVPIVALTANALKGERENALLSGFDDYITKPIQRNELYKSLGRFSSAHH